MLQAHDQLDRRFDELRPLLKAASRPSRGWIRALREALGMTTGQLAKRLGVKQPRVIELERGEASGNVTVQSLERAAEALGCRLVYVLIPETHLAGTMQERATLIANRKLAYVDQTMQLEAQAVSNRSQRKVQLQRIIDELLLRPARLWDEP